MDFESRLRYTAPPLRAWLRESAKTPAYRELSFLAAASRQLESGDFCEAWEAALLARAAADGFIEADLQLLSRLGARLGVSDADSQICCLKESADRLTEHRNAALEKRRKADRLYGMLGAAGGLALAVLLM